MHRFYNSFAEHSIVWNDPDLAIEWPPYLGGQSALAEKDFSGIHLKRAVTL